MHNPAQFASVMVRMTCRVEFLSAWPHADALGGKRYERFTGLHHKMVRAWSPYDGEK